MSLTTRSKAIVGGAATSLGLLALLASPSLADNHNKLTQVKTPANAATEMQMNPVQMQQMLAQCNSMMSRMQGMMGNNQSSNMMGNQNHPMGSGTMTPGMNQ